MLPDTSVSLPAAVRTCSWCYLPIRDLELIGSPHPSAARILCEDDPGGRMFSIYCAASQLLALKPVLELYDAWRCAPLDVETPVLPVRFTADGTALFHPVPEDETPWTRPV